MPKIVDHEKQREKVAEATWEIIRREGIEKATVRNIAEEAGISAGSMRHYFSTQSELFAFSMNLVSERVKKRIETLQFTGNAFEDAQTLLFELLPLDGEKHAEMEVWLVFYVKALSDPALHPFAAAFYDEMKTGIAYIIDALIDHGFAKPTTDRETEITALHALVDGLALHGILHSEKVTADLMRKTILHYLTSICKES